MFVTLRVVPEVARALHGRCAPTPESASVVEAVAEFGVRLVPIHPGIDDPELMRYFAVEVPAQALAERVVTRLRQIAVVDAAYVKPPDQPP